MFLYEINGCHLFKKKANFCNKVLQGFFNHSSKFVAFLKLELDEETFLLPVFEMSLSKNQICGNLQPNYKMEKNV